MYNQNQNEIVCFTLPKISEEEADIQDACCWNDDGSGVAIADGASTSLLPREWADILVKKFCHHNERLTKIRDQWEEWLKPLQEEWGKQSIKLQKDPNVPWYVKGSRDKAYGSATFVGLRLNPTDREGRNIWEAIAVGDSCLFHFKAGINEMMAFPIENSKSFTSVTECFHSLPEYESSVPKYKSGFYEKGDIFLLATDALAQWILKDIEEEGNRRIKLISVNRPEEFRAFIEQLRHDNLINNDDTTMCRLKVVAIPQKHSRIQQQVAVSEASLNQAEHYASTTPRTANSTSQQPVAHQSSNPTWQVSNRPSYPQEDSRVKHEEENNKPLTLPGIGQPTAQVWSQNHWNYPSTGGNSLYQQNDQPITEARTPNSISPASNKPNAAPRRKRFPWKRAASVVVGGVCLIGGAGAGVGWYIVNQIQNNTGSEQSGKITIGDEATGYAPENDNPTTGKGEGSTIDSPSTNGSVLPEGGIPIYRFEGEENDSPIGYLWEKPSKTDSLELWVWVHTPRSYIFGAAEREEKFLKIPDNSKPLPLYINKPTPQELSAEDFAGYLLPGEHFPGLKPKDSPTFNEARWLKIKYKIK
ncbi:MAG: hypothetical protein GDA56_28170 [Hormoscilla sp. GM7CHS1pb]|nr:hypothetical protein [Hormoscilla sp. GM7CHS1pb]